MTKIDCLNDIKAGTDGKKLKNYYLQAAFAGGCLTSV